MPDSFPKSVRETLGEQAADDLSRWIDECIQERAVVRDEYREVLSRLDVLEAEVSGINDRLDRMEERFESRFERIDDRFAQIEDRFAQIDDRFAQIDGRFDKIDQRFEQQSAQFHQRIEEQGAQFNQRIDKVHERIDRLHEQMRVQTRWTVGTIALFGTIVTVLLAIAEFSG